MQDIIIENMTFRLYFVILKSVGFRITVYLIKNDAVKVSNFSNCVNVIQK